jgi:segregation and condensation protein A
LSTEYKVELDAFEGPLDLLLYLIRRAEVDIHDIPVAEITRQYMGYLRQVHTIDIDVAGEFLVMAATLTEIKARMLAPAPQREGDDPGAPGAAPDSPASELIDPRAELVRQLLEYKRFRDAADALGRRRDDWDRRFAATRAGLDKESLADAARRLADVDIEDVTLSDLAGAFAKILATVDFTRLGEHRVVVDETPIEVHAEDLVARLRELGGVGGTGAAGEPAEGAETAPVDFIEIFRGRGRSEMIGLFLALLELVRRRRVSVQQDAPTDRILLKLNAEE